MSAAATPPTDGPAGEPAAARTRHVLDLPLDRPRTAGNGADIRRIHRTQRVLDPALLAAMGSASAHAGCDLSDGLLGAFVATLYRLSGQDDIALGIPGPANENGEWLPLRFAPHAQLRFDALMQACHAGGHEALARHSQAGNARQQATTSVGFELAADLADADASASVPGGESFDLSLTLRPHAQGLLAHARYDADLFDEASVQRWLEMFECVARSAAANPGEPVGQLDVLSAAAAQALVALQPPRTDLVGEPFAHAGFLVRAAASPATTAVLDGERRCSYGELDALSNRLAHALRERGVGRGQRVGLCLERGIDMFVALLAVLKSGAAYVPLDPSFPQARLDYYAQDAGFSLLLTSSGVGSAPRAWCDDAAARVFELDRDTAWQQACADALVPGSQDARPDDAAYVIYTSGSTGKPKGVCVPHRAVANLLQSMQREPGIGPDDRIAAVTTLSFDMAVPEVLLPLAAGAQIVLVQRETAMDGQRLRAMLEVQRITILQATPGMWQLLLEAQWQGRKEHKANNAGPGLRGWIGAEPVRAHLALALLERCTALWNLYGPTETTVWSTAWHMQHDAVASRGVAIGKPIDNTGVWILDAQMQPCPIGVPGEICIGGDGMTLGYLDRPALTAERFVTVRILGTDTPVYRTGDRGRWRNDGLLEHLGRLDFQVKVRGYRIEPGEIEARCNEHAGVSRSVVVAREDHPGDVRLVAYLALVPGTALDRRALTRHLRERLPSYMLPQHVVTLASLPTLPNGKIDRGALPPPHAVAAPTTPVAGALLPAVMRPPLVSRPDRQSAPLTPAQARIYRTEAAHPGRAFHNLPSAQRLHGVLDVARFEAALRAIVERQPALRTCIALGSQDAQPLQSTAMQVELALPTIDLRGLPADQREAELADRMQELADRPIDIHAAPMAHAALFQLDDEDHAFVFVPHQLVWDDASFVLLQRELRALYDHAPVYDHAPLRADTPSALPALASTQGDHAEWLADWAQAPAFEAQLGFWRQRTAPVPVPPPRTDMPRRTDRSGQAGVQPIGIDGATTQRLHDTARGLSVTLELLALGLYALTLGQVTGRETVDIAVAVRGREQPETQGVMGRFDTAVPVSVSVDMRQSLPQFLQRLKQELLTLADHQHAPFERFVAPSPWTFSFDDALEGAAQLAGLQVRRMPLTQRAATEDIALRLVQGAHGLEGALACNSGLYLRETGARLRERYLELLQRAADRPEAALAYIASTEGSASAAWLQKLSDAQAGETETRQPAPVAAADTALAAVHLAGPGQAQLAQVWAHVIRIEVKDIRANDNFFELGGDSLLAQRAVQQTEKLLGYRVEPQRYLFETLEQIAASAAEAARETVPGGSGAAMADALADMPIGPIGPIAPTGQLAPASSVARTPGLLGRAFGGWLRKG